MTHEANNSNMALLDDAAFCATVNKAKLPPGHFSATAGRNDQDVRMTVGRWSMQDKDEWECSICTFLNQPLFLSCEMCGQARPAGAVASSRGPTEAEAAGAAIAETTAFEAATEEVVIEGCVGGGDVIPDETQRQSLLEEEERMLKQERIKEIMALQQGIFNKIREENEEREVEDLEGSFAWMELEDTMKEVPATTTSRVSCGGGFPSKDGGFGKKPPLMDDASSSTVTTAGMSSFSGSSRLSLDWSSQHSRNSCTSSRRSTANVGRNSAIPETALASLKEETAQTTFARSVSLGGSNSHHQNMPPVAHGSVDFNPQKAAQTSLARSVSLGGSSSNQHHQNMPPVEHGYVDFSALKAAVEGVSVRSFPGMEDESNRSGLQLESNHPGSRASFGCVGDSNHSIDMGAHDEPQLHNQHTRRRKALPASANALDNFNKRYDEEKEEEEEEEEEEEKHYNRLGAGSVPCHPRSIPCTPLRRALAESQQGQDMNNLPEGIRSPAGDRARSVPCSPLRMALEESRQQQDLDNLVGLAPVMAGGLRSAAGERARSVPCAPMRRIAEQVRQPKDLDGMPGLAPVMGVNSGTRNAAGGRTRSVLSAPINRAADVTRQQQDLDGLAELTPVMGVKPGIRSAAGERARSVPCAPVRRAADAARDRQNLNNLPELAPVMGANPGIKSTAGVRTKSVPCAPIRRVADEDRRVADEDRQRHNLNNLPELSPVMGANTGIRSIAGGRTGSVPSAPIRRAAVESRQHHDIGDMPDLEPIIGAMAVTGPPAEKESYKERMFCLGDQRSPKMAGSPPPEVSAPKTLFTGMTRAHKRPEERASLPPSLPRLDGKLKIPSPSLVPTDKKNVLTSPRDPVFSRNLYTDRNREAAERNKPRSISPKPPVSPKARKEKSHSVAFPLMGRLLRKKSQKD